MPNAVDWRPVLDSLRANIQAHNQQYQVPIVDRSGNLTGETYDSRLQKPVSQPDTQRFQSHLAYLLGQDPSLKLKPGDKIPDFEVRDPYQSRGIFETISNVAKSAMNESIMGALFEYNNEGKQMYDMEGYRPSTMEGLASTVASFATPVDVAVLAVGGGIGGHAIRQTAKMGLKGLVLDKLKDKAKLTLKNKIKRAFKQNMTIKGMEHLAMGAGSLGAYEGTQGYLRSGGDLQQTFSSTGRGAVMGGSLAFSGMTVGALAALHHLGRISTTAAKFSAEATTLGTVSPLMDSRMPTYEDYTHAAGMVLGLKVSHSLRNLVKDPAGLDEGTVKTFNRARMAIAGKILDIRNKTDNYKTAVDETEKTIPNFNDIGEVKRWNDKNENDKYLNDILKKEGEGREAFNVNDIMSWSESHLKKAAESFADSPYVPEVKEHYAEVFKTVLDYKKEISRRNKNAWIAATGDPTGEKVRVPGDQIKGTHAHHEATAKQKLENKLKAYEDRLAFAKEHPELYVSTFKVDNFVGQNFDVLDPAQQKKIVQTSIKKLETLKQKIKAMLRIEDSRWSGTYIDPVDINQKKAEHIDFFRVGKNSFITSPDISGGKVYFNKAKTNAEDIINVVGSNILSGEHDKGSYGKKIRKIKDSINSKYKAVLFGENLFYSEPDGFYYTFSKETSDKYTSQERAAYLESLVGEKPIPTSYHTGAKIEVNGKSAWVIQQPEMSKKLWLEYNTAVRDETYDFLGWKYKSLKSRYDDLSAIILQNKNDIAQIKSGKGEKVREDFKEALKKGKESEALKMVEEKLHEVIMLGNYLGGNIKNYVEINAKGEAVKYGIPPRKTEDYKIGINLKYKAPELDSETTTTYLLPLTREKSKEGYGGKAKGKAGIWETFREITENNKLVDAGEKPYKKFSKNFIKFMDDVISIINPSDKPHNVSDERLIRMKMLYKVSEKEFPIIREIDNLESKILKYGAKNRKGENESHQFIISLIREEMDYRKQQDEANYPAHSKDYAKSDKEIEFTKKIDYSKNRLRRKRSFPVETVKLMPDGDIQIVVGKNIETKDYGGELIIFNDKVRISPKIGKKRGAEWYLSTLTQLERSLSEIYKKKYFKIVREKEAITKESRETISGKLTPVSYEHLARTAPQTKVVLDEYLGDRERKPDIIHRGIINRRVGRQREVYKLNEDSQSVTTSIIRTKTYSKSRRDVENDLLFGEDNAGYVVAEFKGKEGKAVYELIHIGVPEYWNNFKSNGVDVRTDIAYNQFGEALAFAHSNKGNRPTPALYVSPEFAKTELFEDLLTRGVVDKVTHSNGKVKVEIPDYILKPTRIENISLAPIIRLHSELRSKTDIALSKVEKIIRDYRGETVLAQYKQEFTKVAKTTEEQMNSEGVRKEYIYWLATNKLGHNEQTLTLAKEAETKAAEGEKSTPAPNIDKPDTGARSFHVPPIFKKNPFTRLRKVGTRETGEELLSPSMLNYRLADKLGITFRDNFHSDTGEKAGAEYHEREAMLNSMVDTIALNTAQYGNFNAFTHEVGHKLSRYFFEMEGKRDNSLAYDYHSKELDKMQHSEIPFLLDTMSKIDARKEYFAMYVNLKTLGRIPKDMFPKLDKRWEQLKEEHPNFARAIDEYYDGYKKLEEIDGKDPVKSFMINVSHFDKNKTTIKPTWRDRLSTIMQNMVTSDDALTRTLTTIFKIKNIDMPDNMRADVLKQAISTTPNALRDAMFFGTPQHLDKDFKLSTPLNRHGKPLKSIKQIINDLGSDDAMLKWMIYPYMTKTVKWNDPETVAWYKENNLEPPHTGINLDLASRVIRQIQGDKNWGKITEALGDYQELIKYANDMAVEHGVYTAEQAHKFQLSDPTYIPLKRMIIPEYFKLNESTTDDVYGLFATKKTERRKGSVLGELSHPLEAIQQHFYSIFKNIASKSVKDQFFSNLKDFDPGLTDKGLGRYIERISEKEMNEGKRFSVDLETLKEALAERGAKLEMNASDQEVLINLMGVQRVTKDGRNIIPYGEKNGKPIYWRVDKNIMEAFINFNDSKGLHAFLSIASHPTKLVKNLAVSYNPTFPIRNFMRDIVSAKIYTVNDIKFKELLSGYKESFKFLFGNTYSKDAQDLINYGIVESTLGGMRLLNDKETWKRIPKEYEKSLFDPMKKIAAGIKKFGLATEMGPRLAEYKKALAGGKSIIEAIRDGREVTVDFARGAYISRALNMAIPFYNPQIQGLDKMRRALSKGDEKSFRRVASLTAARAMAYVFLPTLALWYLNKDEQWYQNLSAYDKASWWHMRLPFTNELVRVPKPFDIGMLFGGIFETAFNYAYSEDQVQMAQGTDAVIQRLMPLGTNIFDPIDLLKSSIGSIALFKPFLEWGFNHNFFYDNELVDYFTARKPDELQYYGSTPIAYRFAGDLLNASPIKLRQFMITTTAGIGDDILQLGDLFINNFLEDEDKAKSIYSKVVRTGSIYNDIATSFLPFLKAIPDVERVKRQRLREYREKEMGLKAQMDKNTISRETFMEEMNIIKKATAKIRKMK